MLDSLDAAAVRRWCTASLDGLRRHQHEIDDLNVYPVPDGDTGTNLVLTIGSAQQALAAQADAEGPDRPGEVTRLGAALRCMSRGALLGARGNSGVIVSQLLKGIADVLAQVPRARGRAVAQALEAAATAAYQAVAVPAEGTVLTVARSASRAAKRTDSDDLPEVVQAAARAATEALARTPEQLPVLARAGVVDAGGRGLVVLLDALAEVVTGVPTVDREPAVVARDARLLVVAREAGSDTYAYEVQYLLDAREPDVTELRSVLAGMGDSLVVVGTGAADPSDEQTWNVHVHVNDVGAAIEAGVRAGRPHRIAVTRFVEQIVAHPVDERATGVVAVVSGADLAELFRNEGAVVVNGPAPSTGEVLAAIRATGASRVVVLPNDPDAHGVVAAAATQARTEGIRTGVVPTRSPVQALAALAVRDNSRGFEDDMIAMAEAAGACRYAEVTTATRAAVTVAGLCDQGDVLALVEDEVNLIGKDLVQTCRDLLDRLLAGGSELITLVTGQDAPADLAEVLREHVSARWPWVEVQVYRGGQPLYPLLVGVE